ncbi:protein EMBRYO SAC DEVELOPMENT ARREST 30 isoform X1 [Ipomoea triloba]|uniref:protein EMBRYO SAC DEVELOPMENT ARREST 30 isoform X1 n=1 Tax=Ipomoea triloba TaxID=35885 RepID=UPI00125DB4EA|nr:protein EMBRYO SAC DEVELOPMENT ARREST 30 isoform X1 [Ipomoea triloba]XP_031119178.1 protein EMBRYO SAC DEVELOPMENT ARREST 30 isoform X1 [Ipomoea triloba]
MKSKIKWAALGGLVLSFVSLLVHLFLAKSSADLVQYTAFTVFTDDLTPNLPIKKGAAYRRLWGNVKSLESLQHFADPRSTYPVPVEQRNGFIYAKIFGSFEKIRNSICDLVTVARLLNATLVIPEIQKSTQSKGISSKFRSFSYLYDEEKFIASLANDVIIVKELPPTLKNARRRKELATFKPKITTSPTFYISEVLPKLKKAKVIGLILSDGGCLQSILPPSLAEYQRLRCRVAFHALQFRTEILSLGRLMVERLQAAGQPYLAYHTGLTRDNLAYNGCAELFQDVHTELIQSRRAQMIKEGIINDELSVDSHARRRNGSCPLMPEEVGLLLRAMGYPPRTRIYLAGSESFGGQRSLIPLRAMYPNLVDRTSLCSRTELANLIGPETSLPPDPIQLLPVKSQKQLKEEWDKAGPRPRPLPPPPDRPIYRHEKEGWYGWIAEKDSEPDPSPHDLREQAHSLLWDALDYIVSVQADAFFPGFDNDDYGWPDFSSLVMGNRLYRMASSRTFRPDRKYLVEMFNTTSERLYYPPRNWTLTVREHLNRSITEEGLMKKSNRMKPKLFLSHPIPECSCSTVKSTEIRSSEKKSSLQLLYEGQEQCPREIVQSVKFEEIDADEGDSHEDEMEMEGLDSDGNSGPDAIPSLEQDEEMDPDD